MSGLVAKSLASKVKTLAITAVFSGLSVASSTLPMLAQVSHEGVAAAGSQAHATQHLSRHLTGPADGAGLWLNMWNYPLPENADAYCKKMHNHGIRNLFVQTSRSTTPAICEPARLSALIDAAHRYKIRVICWGYHELANPAVDAAKMIAAAKFTSERGDHIDAVAPNLEKNLDAKAVEAYLKDIRAAIGPNMPIMAVVYSPLNRAPQVAKTPWKLLAKYCDIIAPMAYWNSKWQKYSAYDYTWSTVKMVRQLSGKPDVEVHVIGDGMGTKADSINDFMRACKAAEATSASLYPNHQPTDEQLICLSKYFEYFPVNSRYRLFALRELTASGVIEPLAMGDPAASISRGDFYVLVLRQLDRHNVLAKRSPLERTSLPLDVTKVGAYKLLARVKAVDAKGLELASEESLDDYLRRPMWPREALELVARLVEVQTSLKRLPPTVIEHYARAYRGTAVARKDGEVNGWLGQPAFAERPSAQNAPGARPLSYLDAAQISLDAVSGLR
ncbi:MAG: hypothetical protein DKT66_25395 [Candidatus Melainabacteria bacterium]|nr:MAG: hypothetical protein DKT66_25395 [Candidatus Melainabacteria bacterium]